MPRSAAAPAAPDPLAQYRHLAVLSGTRRPIPLTATRFSVRILGAMALVTAERTFRNAEPNSIEATMTFPVPVHAALVGMSARIGARTVIASAQRKAQARAIYEVAIDGGRTAVLHEEALRGVHMISVGHVPPGQKVTVAGVWAMPLAASVEGAVLVIPTTVGDVYGRSPLPESDDLEHAPIRLEAEIEVACDSGAARLAGGALAGGKARVTLDRPIEIVVAGCTPRALSGLPADGRAVELSVEPSLGGDAALDAVLLQDISGSMSEAATGDAWDHRAVPSKHEVALRGLDGVAAALRPTDRIDVWEFGSAPRHLGLGVGPDGVRAALRGLSEPGGGTELGLAIDAVQRAREGADILLVTDGKSHALDVHGAALRGARFTVILVGEDSLAANVGHLAALTGGQVFVSSGLDLDAVIGMAAASMRRARLRQPRIGGGAQPETACALTGGMLATARWSAAAPAPAADAALGRAVAAYAAWLALPLMPEADAAALAEAEGIVCHLTSLVLVDEAGEAQEGLPAQRKIPLMTPAAHPAFMRRATAIAAAPAMPPAAAPAGDAFAEAPPAMAAPAGGAADMSWGRPLLDIPAFLRRQLTKERPPEPQDRRPLPGAQPAPHQPSLAAFQGGVDWSRNPDALRRGALQGNLPFDVLNRLRQAAVLPEIVALADALGVTGEVVALALLARADGSSDRNAARLARAVLGAADQAMVAAAARAVGL